MTEQKGGMGGLKSNVDNGIYFIILKRKIVNIVLISFNSKLCLGGGCYHVCMRACMCCVCAPSVTVVSTIEVQSAQRDLVDGVDGGERVFPHEKIVRLTKIWALVL